MNTSLSMRLFISTTMLIISILIQHNTLEQNEVSFGNFPELNLESSQLPNNAPSSFPFLDNLENTLVPKGSNSGQIILNVNVIIVQKSDGTGNFNLDNSNHLKILNSIYDHNNTLLANWKKNPENCRTTRSPSGFSSDLNITLNPVFIELKNDYFFDHSNDQQVKNFNTTNKKYLNDLIALVSSLPGYLDNAFDVVMTEGFSDIYKGKMYASITSYKYSDTRRLITHNPRMFSLYNYQLSIGKDPFTTLFDMYYTFIHELFHLLTLQGNQNSCERNIMCGSKCIGDERNQITGYQEARIYKTLLGSHASKTIAKSSYLESNAELSINTNLDREVLMLSNLVIKSGTTLTINQNGIINMANDRTIIVEEGAKLVLNGGVIRAFDDQWNGIVVEESSLVRSRTSTPLKTNNLDGIIIQNGGLISYAKNEVSTPRSLNEDQKQTNAWVMFLLLMLKSIT